MRRTPNGESGNGQLRGGMIVDEGREVAQDGRVGVPWRGLPEVEDVTDRSRRGEDAGRTSPRVSGAREDECRVQVPLHAPARTEPSPRGREILPRVDPHHRAAGSG